MSAFETVAADILKGKRPLAKYIDPKKQKPGFLGSQANVLPGDEFGKKFIANRTRAAEASLKVRLAKLDAQRNAELGAAAKAPEPDRSRLTAKANSDYELNKRVIEADTRVEISSARANAYAMNGFVDDDGQLYINMDGPEPARTARHEAIHMYASPEWDRKIGAGKSGHALDEAVTEYFTQQEGFASNGSSNLKAEYTEGSQLVRQRYSEDALARAYFQGDLTKMNKEYPVAATISEFEKKFPH